MGVVQSDSVDAVWSSHNLEHLRSHEVGTALREFHRVLTPGGFALIAVPDLQQVAEIVATGRLEEPVYESPAGPISPIDIVYGHRASVERGNLFMEHHTGFTADSLSERLRNAGFQDVRVDQHDFELTATAFKPAAAPTPS
jgi:ubiquinone/menaquinone biosynthesis C-methylase UbiE